MKSTDKIRALLKSIETGNAAPIEYVNVATHIQQNPQTHEGGDGRAALVKHLSKVLPRVNVVRAIQGGGQL